MKNYKVELVLTGTMTQVPDSQKLFGALVYLFAETYGDARATRLTKAMIDKDIHLALSNVLPDGYLPTPQDYLVDRIAENRGGEVSLKNQRAAIKERSYIHSENLKSVLNNPKSCLGSYPYVKQQDFQQLRASIDSVRYDMPELDTRLYSVPTVTLSEISLDKRGKKCERPVHRYCFYLQTDGSDDGLCSDLLGMLGQAAADGQVLILGKRASQGMNRFRIKTVTDQPVSSSEGKLFLNTGMLLPDCIDFKRSSLKLFTSERRPFEMVGGWSEDAPKHYISFIAPGSVIDAPEGLAHAGKSVASYFRKNRDIVFGNAFLYPVLDRGQV